MRVRVFTCIYIVHRVCFQKNNHSRYRFDSGHCARRFRLGNRRKTGRKSRRV